MVTPCHLNSIFIAQIWSYWRGCTVIQDCRLILDFSLPSLEVIAAVVKPFAKIILSWYFLSLNFKWSGLAGLMGAEPVLKYGGGGFRGGSLLLVLLSLSWMEKPALDWFPIVSGVLFKERLTCWRSLKDISIPLCEQREMFSTLAFVRWTLE